MPAAFTTRPELKGNYGMISTTHWLATGCAMSVLERGGNAFDAAACAGFVVQVVEPHLTGPCGEVPIVFRDGRTGAIRVAKGQGPAPKAATIERFHSLGLQVIPNSGYLPACVPGSFGAWMLLVREFGTMRVRDILAYAIGYAEQGYPVLPRLAAVLKGVETLFRTEWTDSASVWLANGVPQPGTMLVNPRIARTYRRIVAEAENGGGTRRDEFDRALSAFYDGFVAEAVDRHLSSTAVIDTSGERHLGLLRGDDLFGWRATIEEPVRMRYRNFEVNKTQPWGQGPVFLQQLSLLEGYDLKALGHLTPDFMHLVIEAAKLAFADREAWYGDPKFAQVPLDDLLSQDYAASRRGSIGERASLDLRPGSPGGRVPHLPDYHLREGVVQPDDAGELPVAAGASRGDTCHIDVIDRFGNAVAATPSGGAFQSSPAIPALGFGLSVRGQMFNLEPGLPNALEPGKTPRTTLSPTIAQSDDLLLAFGTRGGDKQDQWTLSFFLNVAEFGMNLQEAIDAPNFHTTHCPDSFYPHKAFPGEVRAEERIPSETIAELRRRGHDVHVEGPWSLGHVCAVGRDERRGILIAGANPRGMTGYAAGR